MKNSLIAFLIFFSFNYAQAIYGEKKAVLYFANGMFNSAADADKSLDELSIRMRETYPKDKFDSFEVAYNTNESALLQLHQVFRQKITDTSISFWRNIGKLFELEKGENLKKILRLLNAEQTLTDKDLQKQILDYNKYLKNNFKIITVAHSQGNLYTNFAFDSIGSDKTQMISVATPASNVYGEGPYFTFFSDRVITHIPHALPPNRKKQKAGYFDHAFIPDYMGNRSTENEILSAIDANYNSEIENSAKSLNPSEAYFNSDMSKILKWFDVYSKEKRNLSDAECLIVESLFALYARHSLSCEERNFITFQNAVDDCDNYINRDYAVDTYCPYYAGMDVFEPVKAFYPIEAVYHYQLNPQCDMSFERFKKVGKDQVREAKSIYKALIEN